VPYPAAVDDDLVYATAGYVAPDGHHLGAIFNQHSSIVLQSIGRCLSLYMQIEYANVAVDDTKDPKTDIPFALMAAVGIQFIFGTVNPIIGASISPGVQTITLMRWPVVPGKLLPKDPSQMGAVCLFHVTVDVGIAKVFGMSQHHAALLLVPIYVGRSSAATFCLGKLLSSMAGSHLFPTVFARRFGNDGSPLYALTAISLIYFIVSLVSEWTAGPTIPDYAGPAVNLVSLCGLITYSIQLFGFVVLRVKLSRIATMFRSPFGMTGAVASLLVFLVGMASALVVPQRQRTQIIVLAALFILIPTAYYYLYAKDMQTFSDPEKEVLLVAHAEIKNANGTLAACSLRVE
jgi:ethanolamine permease